MMKIGTLLLLGLVALVPATRGQDRSSQGTAPVDSRATTAPATSVSTLERLLLGNQLRAAPAGARDPFGTPERMRLRAESGADGPRFVAGNVAAIPKLALRGYVEPRGKPAVALIEVEGQGVYVVRAGDNIGLTIAGRSTVLRVQAIEASSARVEAGSLGQVIVVR